MQSFTTLYRNLPVELTKLPGGLCFPVKYAVIRRMSVRNTFGMVRRRANGKPRPHQGWDFYAPGGYRCYAIADGEIVAVRNRGALGLHVLLKFEFDFDGDGKTDTLYATYCHLNEARVRKGQRVNKGDVIGQCGDSGNARGMKGNDAHLHFEIRTRAFPGLGLFGRMSPMAVFGEIPLKSVMVTDPILVPSPAASRRGPPDPP